MDLDTAGRGACGIYSFPAIQHKNGKAVNYKGNFIDNTYSVRLGKGKFRLTNL